MKRIWMFVVFLCLLLLPVFAFADIPTTPHNPFAPPDYVQVMPGSNGTSAMFVRLDDSSRVILSPETILWSPLDASQDSLLQVISDYVSVTYIEGCDVILNQSVGAGAYATSSPFTSGPYDQLTLFITKSGDGDATDSLYVIGSFDTSVSGNYAFFSLTTSYAFAVDMTGFDPNQFFVTLPVDNCLPYLAVKVKNNSGGAITWTVRICGKSRHGE